MIDRDRVIEIFQRVHEGGDPLEALERAGYNARAAATQIRELREMVLRIDRDDVDELDPLGGQS